MKLRNRCCCAPYPTVDLTEAFPSSSSQKKTDLDEHLLKDIQEQVTHACERYGCFHVTLSASKLSQEEESSDFSIFQDEKVVRKTFDSIFRHENNHDHNTAEETCGSSCCISSFFTSPVDGSTRAARYRGRSAESGSSFGMEPKQSWEIFRCQNMLPAVTRSSSFSSTRTQQGTKNNDDDQQHDLGILHQYMEVLHKVSVCLLRDVLELPYFVDSDACQCGNTEQLFCSVDLLRAFQYDAVESSQVLSNLGSSPHTDWGSLTVVWQDSKGGLQIYCHEHQIWNDVEIGKDDSTSDDGSEGLIRFFIHVGDFTSLVMNHAKDSTANGSRKEEEEVEDRLVWPSPLHRVLCPTLLDDEDDGNHKDDGSRNTELESSTTRCSLVYFAYPTKGLSLEDVQNSVSDKIQEQSHHHDDDVPYERFLVLNDQSKEGGGGHSAIMEEPEQVYQKIKSIPFHQVIQDKWKQVQR
jgi:Isopenicillin N synthase and related dioxygenases